MENYTVVRRLGGGAQGVATLAVDKRTGQQVVIKKIPSGMRSSEEINVTLRVKHPNIIECLEVFTQEDMVNIVTRYAEGGDLEAYIEKCRTDKRSIPVGVINRWVGQLCRALHYCHQSRVIHRDVKPGNIFLSQDFTQAYLGDFGVAKIFQGSLDVATTFVGSPAWLSPEVLSGTPYGCMADVWSLGCVFYEMMTLRQPFSAPHFAALVMKICSGQYDALPSIVQPHLAAIVEGMLNIDVNERWLLTDVVNSSEFFSEQRKPVESGDAVAAGAAKKDSGRSASSGPRGRRSSKTALSNDHTNDMTQSSVDLQDWVRAKLRDISTIEKYLNRHKINDVIVLQQRQESAQLSTPQLSDANLGANLNPDRAKRWLPSPNKQLPPGDMDVGHAHVGPVQPPLVVVPRPAQGDGDGLHTPSSVDSPQPVEQRGAAGNRWADPSQGAAKFGRRQQAPTAPEVLHGVVRDISPPNASPDGIPRGVSPPSAHHHKRHHHQHHPHPAPQPQLQPKDLQIPSPSPAQQQLVGAANSGGAQPHPKLHQPVHRPASGQPVQAMPDIPTPPSKLDKREAQRQDIKAMIREQRARAAASGGDVSVEILLPANLRNLPQNKV